MKKINIFKYIAILPILGSTAIPLSLVSCGDSKITITVKAGEGGKITSDTTIKVDASTTWGAARRSITYTTNTGYALSGWYIGDEKITDGYTITEPVTITYKFTSTVVLTLDTSIEGGSITGPSKQTVKPGTKWGDISDQYEYSQTSEQEATYTFDDWYVGTTKLTSDYTFNSAVTITAKFVTCTITYEAGVGGTISGTTTTKVKPGTKWSAVTSKPTCNPSSSYTFDNYYLNNSVLSNDTELTDEAVTISAEFKLTALPEATISTTAAHAYIFNYDSGKYEDYSGEHEVPASYPISTINSQSIGYMTLEDYMDYYIDEGLFKVTNDTANSQTILTNILEGNGSKCIIDFLRQTITFEDYETFMDYSNEGTPKPLVTAEDSYYTTTIKTYKKTMPKIIDLKKYNIVAYFKDGKGYLPYEVINNVFSLNLVDYYDDTYGWQSPNMDWNGKGLYEILEGNNQSYVNAKALAKGDSSFYNSTYMEYCYNLFALTLDTKFGLRVRHRRNDGTTAYYLPNGAYAALQPYHDDLVSTAADSSANAMREFFRVNLDDGGHSGYFDSNVFSQTGISVQSYDDYYKYYGKEYLDSMYLYWSMTDARDDAGLSYYDQYEDEDIIYEPYKTYGSGSNTIAYVTFDSFDYVNDFTQSEYTTYGRKVEDYTNTSNYMNDTLRLTMWANKQIQANNIKNVVVDLSCNGGGYVFTEHFIASWLCGGVTEKIYNPTTNSYCEYTVNADIDGDGTVDDYDHLAEDVNLYVITSSCSFSCGNMLPTNIQDNRPKNTTFIGTKSGGGACFVNSGVLLGLGSTCQFSSTYHMLRGDSEYGNYISNDDGNTITSGWAFDETTSSGIKKFFDRTSINKKIWA